MTNQDTTPEVKRVAFISTRIAGTDGVSLEIEKWARVLERNGVECCYIAGELDRPAERCALIEEAHFTHPEVRRISEQAFDTELRTRELTDLITRLTRSIGAQLHEALDRLDVQGLIVENALTIPMNIPLGIALVQVIQERGIGCIAHHHDFYWERERFLINAVDDLLRYAFPPALPQIQHVVINSLAGEEFSRRTGLSCRIIPNAMDFANPPTPPDDYALRFKREIGLEDDDLIFLQPTRVVERKGIGTPDSLCDAAAEALSVDLCNYYLEHFGRILHYNVDKVALVGNVNCGLLQNGTDDEVIADVRRALRDGMPGGGYIFGTSNCVYTGMDLDRYDLMLKTWREFGVYG